MTKVRFIGLDVHAETIAVAVAEPGGEVRSVGVISNRLESIRKMAGKLGKPKELKFCYEAGPTGYVLYWQLTQLGYECMVVAPSLVPVKAGDRVKTDRRDAEKLARCLRAGDLTAVWVPDAAHEALRDLIRAREAGKKDQLRARHRLSKFLLRHGQRQPDGMKAWAKKYLEWIKAHVRFDQPALEITLQDYFHEVEHAAERIIRLEKAIDEAIKQAPEEIREVIEALQALRGVAQITAATIVSELGSITRFASATDLMGYSGLVPGEHSSGSRVKRGAVTKTGNAHLRRVIVEAAWAYQHRPWIGGYLAKRQRDLTMSTEVKEIAWKAQNRLHKRYIKLTAAGKNKNQTVTAVGRELLGFIWAIGTQVAAAKKPQAAAAA
jgi:transposase